jgi:hypothetical protein
MKNNFAKWKPYIFLAILLLSLIPLIWLGRYNYPTRRLLLRCGDSSGLAADREHHTNA